MNTIKELLAHKGISIIQITGPADTTRFVISKINPDHIDDIHNEVQERLRKLLKARR